MLIMRYLQLLYAQLGLSTAEECSDWVVYKFFILRFGILIAVASSDRVVYSCMLRFSCLQLMYVQTVLLQLPQAINRLFTDVACSSWAVDSVGLLITAYLTTDAAKTWIIYSCCLLITGLFIAVSRSDVDRLQLKHTHIWLFPAAAYSSWAVYSCCMLRLFLELLHPHEGCLQLLNDQTRLLRAVTSGEGLFKAVHVNIGLFTAAAYTH